MELHSPSEQTAKALLEDVEAKDYLKGSMMEHGPGPRRRRIYCLGDLEKFLRTDEPEELQQIRGGRVGYLEYSDLIDWIEQVVGDPQLAEAIEDAIDEDAGYRKNVENIRPLIKTRMEQCEELVRRS